MDGEMKNNTEMSAIGDDNNNGLKVDDLLSEFNKDSKLTKEEREEIRKSYGSEKQEISKHASSELDRNIQRYRTAKSDHARGMKFKELAGETVISEKMTEERYFAEGQLSDVKKRNFLKFSESQKRDILRYFEEGLADNPGITQKQKRQFGGSLVSYYFSLANTREYIDEKRKGNTGYEYKGGMSLGVIGADIEKHLSRHGKGFSEPGKELDVLILKTIEAETTRKSDERIKRMEENIRISEETVKILNEINKIVERLNGPNR